MGNSFLKKYFKKIQSTAFFVNMCQYVRKDENYHAIHIYLKSSSNIYLPWEVQIWKKEDEQVNESEHKNHKSKRKYINWIDMYEREE